MGPFFSGRSARWPGCRAGRSGFHGPVAVLPWSQEWFSADQPDARAAVGRSRLWIWLAHGQPTARRSLGAPAAPDEAPATCEDAQPQALRFPAAGTAVQGEHLRPGQQRAGQRDALAPDLVLGESLQGEVARAVGCRTARSGRRSPHFSPTCRGCCRSPAPSGCTSAAAATSLSRSPSAPPYPPPARGR